VDTSVWKAESRNSCKTEPTWISSISQKKGKELLNEVARLEEENQRLMAGKESSKDLNKHFQEASQGLTAFEWFYKAYSLWDDGKITEPQKAMNT